MFLCAALVMFLVPSLARAANAPVDSVSAMNVARAFRPYVSENRPGPLWAAFDDRMRAAMGDSTRFAAAMDGIHAQVGAIREVLSEDIALSDSVWVYRASCRFDKSDDPLLLMIALTPGGKIAGLAVRPQAKEYASPNLDYVTKTPLQLPFGEVKYKIVEDVIKSFTNDGYHVVVLDNDLTLGGRIELEDGWALVRASSNLPVLVLRFEATTKKRLQELMDLVRRKLATHKEVSSDWESG